MTEAASRFRLWQPIGLGLVLRLVAAVVVDRLAKQRGLTCLFPDTEIYWQLGQAIRRGAPYVVSQWGVPHFALRTPGYPLFLACCQTLFGNHTLPARFVEAVLGAGCVGLVFRLTSSAAPTELPGRDRSARAAAWLTACDPGTIALSVLLLSEAVFVPLMLLGLWGLAELTSNDRTRCGHLIAVGSGLAWGLAVLAKPSWLLFPPMILLLGIVARWFRFRRDRLLGTSLVALGLVVAMAPWWLRNQAVFGRFVPTALWMGASLYDGLSPNATGASDMTFLDAPDLRGLSEDAQDAELRRRAWRFVREHPARSLTLAGIKAARFWSPWPNAENLRSRWVAIGSALGTLPVFLLVLVGIVECRRDLRTLALLVGPVLYFAAIHMVFVSSIRYRLPGMVPAFGLAGIGWSRFTRMLPGGRFRSG